MTNQQILRKAIEKAKIKKWDDWLKDWESRLDFIIECRTYYRIIFSHDFVKAFWGDAVTTKLSNNLYRTERFVWQYQLQQMVLEKEPLKYIEKFL